MSKLNKLRGGCRDVFHAFLVENARFSGMYDIPVIRPERRIPRKLIRFSQACREETDFNQWVMFYEDDFQFERIWNSPKRYLNRLRKFEGVITPDFSLYYDMPLAMQIWNIYRSRAIGTWLQQNGIHVIPNIRIGSRDTYEIACSGLSRHGVISVGTLGCLEDVFYRKEFERGIEWVIGALEPETVIFYGGLPRCAKELKTSGINIIHFSADYSFFKKEER